MMPSECALLEGTTWQFTQASAFDSAGAVAPWFTCARCTPATPVAVATAGGDAAWFTSAPATLTRPVVPWQEVQDMLERSTVPSTCRAGLMIDWVALL